MHSTIESLFYGSDLPIGSMEPTDPEYLEMVRWIGEIEEMLSKQLNEEGNTELGKLENLHGQIVEYAQCEAFRAGFRMGVRFVAEAFIPYD